MQDDFDISRYKWIIPIMIIILVITLFFSRCSNDTLESFDSSAVESSSITDDSNNESISLDENTALYQDVTNNFQIDVPVNWVRVEAAGDNVSFVDKSSGSKLDITINPYDPLINNIDEATLSAQAESSQMIVQEFKKQSSSSYSVSYNDDSYGYIECNHWDKDKIIKIAFTTDINLFNSSDMNKRIKYIINSFQWQSANPIPDNIFIKYYEYGKFQIGFIDGWAYGESSNTLLSSNSDNTASITVSVTEADNISGISKVDYTNYLAQSKENFILSSFINDNNMIQCSGTYTLNGQTINMTQYIICSGSFEYIVSFDSITSETSSLTEDFQNVINTFKIFKFY